MHDELADVNDDPNYPLCDRCPHPWHGLACTAGLTKLNPMGRRVRDKDCGCAGPFGQS